MSRNMGKHSSGIGPMPTAPHSESNTKSTLDVFDGWCGINMAGVSGSAFAGNDWWGSGVRDERKAVAGVCLQS